MRSPLAAKVASSDKSGFHRPVFMRVLKTCTRNSATYTNATKKYKKTKQKQTSPPLYFQLVKGERNQEIETQNTTFAGGVSSFPLFLRQVLFLALISIHPVDRCQGDVFSIPFWSPASFYVLLQPREGSRST